MSVVVACVEMGVIGHALVVAVGREARDARAAQFGGHLARLRSVLAWAELVLAKSGYGARLLVQMSGLVTVF